MVRIQPRTVMVKNQRPMVATVVCGLRMKGLELVSF